MIHQHSEADYDNKKKIDMSNSAKGYRAISKSLWRLQTTVSAIIHEMRKHGAVVNIS